MEIRIAKTARECHASGRVFEHGEQIVSLVRFADEGYAREDYAREAWETPLGNEAIAVWTTEYRDPKVEEAEPPEVFTPLRKVFYDAAEAEGRAETAIAYLASQLLRRQKAFRLLKESDGEEGDARVCLFADRIGNRMIEVPDPALTFDELDQARRALMERLKDLENPSGEAEAEEDTTEESNGRDQEA